MWSFTGALLGQTQRKPVSTRKRKKKEGRKNEQRRKENKIKKSASNNSRNACNMQHR